ncbi:MAG: tRNA (adenosine(37)-N6)-threonylcarbamoyltransferase complex ATPase subunit type 1 TsaE [Ruminococcus sp.]|jgi:tRNA threonylcarbamoyladenosine biosynthesis protein TsaE|nr:tRNA (adenosine(37)-N6)-threonylcarbamoyltransferase complex ATPase subunit type 1 TsaE [Ruminococcus sp.]
MHRLGDSDNAGATGTMGGAAVGEYLSDNVKITEKLGAEFAENLKSGDIVAFYGGLGAGKTAFIRGICAFFGVTEVSSPTFTIVNEYQSETAKIYHFDMYRITSEADLESIGFFDYTDGIILIEWFENIEDFGVAPTHIFRIENIDETSRRITIN